MVRHGDSCQDQFAGWLNGAVETRDDMQGGRDGAAVAVLLSQGNTVTCGGWIEGAVST